MMELTPLFQSLIDQDQNPIVLCDTEHVIRYMNPAAISAYASYGGEALMGKRVMDCHKPASRAAIEKVVTWFAQDKAHNRVHTMFVEKENLDVYMIALRGADGQLIGYYEQQVCRIPDPAPLYELQ